MRYEEMTIEGRNAVLEAFRSGKTIDKLFVLDGCQDGPVKTITREARKSDTIINYVSRERLDQMSATGKHQGVIAFAAAFEYAQVDDMLKLAQEKGEPPFLFLLDGIEDPHNLGAIIRRDYPQAQGGGPDRYGGESLGRGPVLYAGGKGHQSVRCDRGLKEKGILVRLCGYGGRAYVPPESDRAHGPGDRKRGGGREPPDKGSLRFPRIHSHEGRYRLLKRLRGGRRAGL